VAETKTPARGIGERVRQAAGTGWLLANRARGRPVSFLARKVIDLTALYLRGVGAAVGLNPYESPAGRTIALKPGLVTESAALEEALDRVKKSRPEDIQHVLHTADKARSGTVEILSHIADESASEAWDTDFVGGAKWPVRFHASYMYSDLLDLGRHSDIKIPWELARMQVLPSLALAYRLTDDVTYVDAATKRFRSWDRACPVGFGVTWAVGMEVALRAISILLTSEILASSDAHLSFVTPRLTESMAEHGRFLFRNIEYSDINGNHHISCLLGLLYLGLAMPSHPESGDWRATAVRGLMTEIVAESYPDGVCHEGSIPYHRLVSEIFLHAALLARRNRIDFGLEFHSRLQRMLDFTAAYIKPNGEAPVWGDADDGRIHSVGSQDVNDHRYLLSLAAALYERADFAAHGGALQLDAAFLMDADLQKAQDRQRPTAIVRRSEAFAQGGFFILGAADGFALVDCGDVGLRGRGGHGHHDTLAVELSLGGLDVLSDTGCASYTRDRRERWASLGVQAHNVGSLDAREPAPFSDERLTQAGAYQCDVRAWDPIGRRFHGVHRGFGGKAVFSREVALDSSGRACTFADSFTAAGEHSACWMFHFAEKWATPRIELDRAVLGQEAAVVELSWDRSDVHVTALRTSVYPRYGLRRMRWALRIEATFMDSLAIRFEIRLQKRGSDR